MWKEGEGMTISSEVFNRMVKRRRDFHMYPETGWAEFRTTAKVAAAISEAGYEPVFGGEFIKPEYVLGRDADAGAEMRRAALQGADRAVMERMKGLTGLIADFDSGRPGPVTALRFDIDCVDVQESDDTNRLPVREGFLSRNPGRTHACAHDGHTVIGLALAELITTEKDKYCGKIRFIFQPAEEGVRGGYAMTMSGVVDDADNFIALHLGMGLRTGEMAAGVNGFLCTTKFNANVTGVAAHAGAEPEKGRNALLAASEAVINIHQIPQRHSGIVRVNVGVLNAGVGRNVVPPNAFMKIETRGDSHELAEQVYREAEDALLAAANKYGVEVSVTKHGESVCADSDAGLAAIVAEAAKSVPGIDEVRPVCEMFGSDDACWMMRRVQERGGRGVYSIIGADLTAGHHNGAFDFDESAMGTALEVLHGTLLRTNGI